MQILNSRSTISLLTPQLVDHFPKASVVSQIVKVRVCVDFKCKVVGRFLAFLKSECRKTVLHKANEGNKETYHAPGFATAMWHRNRSCDATKKGFAILFALRVRTPDPAYVPGE